MPSFLQIQGVGTQKINTDSEDDDDNIECIDTQVQILSYLTDNNEPNSKS